MSGATSNSRWTRGLAMVVLMAPTLAVAQLPPTPGADRGTGEKRPRLYVSQRIKDLGLVIEGDKKPLSWTIENVGQADLVIDQVRSTCGCTLVALSEDRKVIPPGESLEIEAEFDSSGRVGEQHKSITVYSNDPVEAALSLEFKASIEVLYESRPSGVVNLRMIQRGQVGSRTLDLIPGPGRKKIELQDVEISQGTPVVVSHDAYKVGGASGQRITFATTGDTPVGRLNSSILISFTVDGIARQRKVVVVGEVVGDLTWLPKVVDATRAKSMPGKKLAPITIRSPAHQPFEILGASAGSLLDVTVEKPKRPGPQTKYKIHLQISREAKPGPFGETVHIRTSSLDQPLVSIPVFGIVTPPIEIDPALVLLRQDGTAVGAQRRLKLQASPQTQLDVGEISCDLQGVVGSVNQEASSRYRHLRYLDIKLVKELPKGRHEGMLTIRTNVKGGRTLEVPVVVDVPAP